VTDTGIIKIADRMFNQITYLDIGCCENISEAGKFYAKEKIRGVKLVVEEPNPPMLNARPENPNRQVGFTRGRQRPDRESLVAVFDDEYERIPVRVRERMMLAMDRRRRNLHPRMLANRHPVAFQEREDVEMDLEYMRRARRLPREVLLQMEADDDDTDEGDSSEDEDEMADLEEHVQGPAADQQDIDYEEGRVAEEEAPVQPESIEAPVPEDFVLP
jgi:hypothetical protein